VIAPLEGDDDFGDFGDFDSGGAADDFGSFSDQQAQQNQSFGAPAPPPALADNKVLAIFEMDAAAIGAAMVRCPSCHIKSPSLPSHDSLNIPQ